MLNRNWISFCVLVFVVCAVGACATGSSVPEAQPMPHGKSFSGVWYSPQFEHMHLVQQGNSVRGIYTYKNGGTIRGRVDGNLLTFQWEEPGDRVQARRGFSGHGYLTLLLTSQATLLSGEWGYEDKFHGAGPWEAEFIRPLEENDALTLDELRR